MGRNITDFTNYIAPDSTYPYGDIKDNPGDGTGTRVSRTTNADMQQFFQRIAANAGVFLNGTPDNMDNGFQYVEALNTLINQQTAGMAGAAGASGLVPVIMSGMVVHSGPTSTIDPGWFFYDGQYCFFEGGGYASIPGGDVRLITITYIDGFPNATLSLDTPVSDSTHFDFSNAISWAKSVGIITLQNDVITINAALSALQPLAWTSATLGTGWNTSAIPIAYTKNGVKEVFLRGWSQSTSTTPTQTLFTLPSGFRPSQICYIPVYFFDTGTITQGTNFIAILTTGEVQFVNPAATPITSGYNIYLDAVKFLTL